MQGRPKLDIVPPRKYTRVFEGVDGNKETWFYDLDKFPNGPIKVEIDHSAPPKPPPSKNAELSLTERKYYNPSTGKYVGYGRAKQLKLI
jgi:hypothetical protein